MRRVHLAVLAPVALALSGCMNMGSINSNLTVQPGETFLLGGNQPAGFTVAGTNSGPVAVDILLRGQGGDTPVATVAPGGDFQGDFGAGETAVVRNTSTDTAAQVRLTVTGYTEDLGMRSVPTQ